MLPPRLTLSNVLRRSVIMTNKTPFEVRLDILKMAQDMLNKETEINQSKFYAKLETLRTSNSPVEEINGFIDTNMPKMYDSAEIVSRSTALYNFVSDSSKSKS